MQRPSPRFRSEEYFLYEIACVAWRFSRAGRTSGEVEDREICAKQARTRGEVARKIKLLPPQSPRGFSALARLYYLARPTKTAMLRRLYTRYPKKCFTQIYRDLYIWRRHAGAHPVERQRGGRKPTETSVTKFCYKSVNLFFEELINIKVILFQILKLFR